MWTNAKNATLAGYQAAAGTVRRLSLIPMTDEPAEVKRNGPDRSGGPGEYKVVGKNGLEFGTVRLDSHQTFEEIMEDEWKREEFRSRNCRCFDKSGQCRVCTLIESWW